MTVDERLSNHDYYYEWKKNRIIFWKLRKRVGTWRSNCSLRKRPELRATLEYDFLQENFIYKGFSMEEIIHHLAVFVSRLWQIHIFGEENTRATAVFLIKYLRTLGFSATNDIFAKNAWYFRNALVPANYTNLQKGIHETTEYLEVFLRNLLRLYIRRTGSNSKCISSDNYTSAVKKNCNS